MSEFLVYAAIVVIKSILIIVHAAKVKNVILSAGLLISLLRN
jgi:hypothetical protein